MADPVPILMYHQYHSSLAMHIERLYRYGYRTAHLRDISAYLEDPSGVFPAQTVVLTFDDAYQDFQNAIPILEAFDAKATLCVPAGFIATVESERQQSLFWSRSGAREPLLLWDELLHISQLRTTESDSRVELIPHSMWHISFTHDLMKDNVLRLRDELQRSRDVLVSALHIEPPRFFCFPFGAGWQIEESATVNRLLRETGYVGALRADYSGESWNRYCIPRWSADSIVALLR